MAADTQPTTIAHAMKKMIQRAARRLGYDIRKAKRGPVYDRDGLYTGHNHAFVNAHDFQQAYWRGVNGTTGDSINTYGEWRVHIALWAAQNAFRREGDFVECGVCLGFMSSAIMTYLRWNEEKDARRYVLVDNFEGIVPSLLTDEEKQLGRAHQFGDIYSSTYERAVKNLSEFANVDFVKGNVPDVLSQVQTNKIAFLHLDMNATIPEISALSYFWDKLIPGAFVLLDDYAYNGYEPQQRAFDELSSKLGFSVVSLPTGQGLIIK